MARRDKLSDRGVYVSLGVESGRSQKTRGPMKFPTRRLQPSQPEGCSWPPIRLKERDYPPKPEQDDARPDLNKKKTD